MKAGDVVLFYSTGWWAKIVDRLTQGKYFHCEFMITSTKSMKIYEKGTVENTVNPKLKGKQFDVWIPEYPSEKSKLRAINHAKKLIEKSPKYGFVHFMSFLFIKQLRRCNITWFEGDRFMTCNEGTNDCQTVGLVRKFKLIPNSLITPNDIPRIFEGKFE